MSSVADMLTRIRNAQMARHEAVNIPFSKLKFAIARILKREGFIDDFAKKNHGSKKYLRIMLKYRNEEPAIGSLKIVSKPSKRIYVNKEDLSRIKRGLGIAIISTSRGILTLQEAKKQGVGGEVLCEIW